MISEVALWNFRDSRSCWAMGIRSQRSLENHQLREGAMGTSRMPREKLGRSNNDKHEFQDHTPTAQQTSFCTVKIYAKDLAVHKCMYYTLVFVAILHIITYYIYLDYTTYIHVMCITYTYLRACDIPIKFYKGPSLCNAICWHYCMFQQDCLGFSLCIYKRDAPPCSRMLSQTSPIQLCEERNEELHKEGEKTRHRLEDTNVMFQDHGALSALTWFWMLLLDTFRRDLSLSKNLAASWIHILSVVVCRYEAHRKTGTLRNMVKHALLSSWKSDTFALRQDTESKRRAEQERCIHCS